MSQPRLRLFFMLSREYAGIQKHASLVVNKTGMRQANKSHSGGEVKKLDPRPADEDDINRHSERSEESLKTVKEILRVAQDDKSSHS